MNFALPDGTALADATGEQIHNVADWLNAVADQLRPEQTLAEWISGPQNHNGRAKWRPEPQSPVGLNWRS